MFAAAVDDRHLQAQLFEHPTCGFETTSGVQGLHEAIRAVEAQLITP